MKKLFIITGILILSLLSIATSCKKKPVKPDEPAAEVSKYETIQGRYKMYDTLGNYLYDMEIKHIQGNGSTLIPKDSLMFTNFEEKYDFTSVQNTGTPSNYAKYSFNLGVFDPLIDYEGKKTFFFGYSAHCSNDSIYMYFKRDNVKYYISQMTPYFICQCKRIGVKQH